MKAPRKRQCRAEEEEDQNDETEQQRTGVKVGEGETTPTKRSRAASSAQSRASSTSKETEQVCWVEELLPDELLCQVLEQLPEDMVAVAARTCRRWFRCSSPPLRRTLFARRACTRVPLFQWASQNGYAAERWHTCLIAAEHGALGLLQWLRAQGWALGGDLCARAASSGHLAVLRWLREQGCRWGPEVLGGAAVTGHVEVLEWAKAHGCPDNPNICQLAAIWGHLGALKWAREHSYAWDEEVCRRVVDGGHLKALQWLRAHGCPWNAGDCLRAAEKKGHKEIVVWIRGEAQVKAQRKQKQTTKTPGPPIEVASQRETSFINKKSSSFFDFLRSIGTIQRSHRDRQRKTSASAALLGPWMFLRSGASITLDHQHPWA
ncbi:Ankyrin repeat domain containing protein [Balamuthia mandrillaris]